MNGYPFFPSTTYTSHWTLNFQTQEPNLLQQLLVKPLELVIISLNPPLFSTTRHAFLQSKHVQKKVACFKNKKQVYTQFFLHSNLIVNSCTNRRFLLLKIHYNQLK